MTCTKGQDLRRYIVEYHKRPSGDKIVVDVFLEVGQYVPGRVSTLGGKSPGEEGYRGGSARPSVRADERTRTADLVSLRVINHVLQGFAEPCKFPLSKGIPFLCLAPCCTVLRSRWCQSGVKRTRVHFVQRSSVPILRPSSQRTQALSSYSPHSNPLPNCKKHLQPTGHPPILCTVAEVVESFLELGTLPGSDSAAERA
jgi:hypothetical protein